VCPIPHEPTAHLEASLCVVTRSSPRLSPPQPSPWATAESVHRRTAAVELDDPTIVAIFDAANTADIETGKLAAERGHSAEVREFGAMLARDHQHVRQLGRDLANTLGVSPTPPKDDKGAEADAKAMATLRAKAGAEFDRAFLRHEAEFHKSVIGAIQSTLLPAIRNDDLRALVVKVAPAFQAHMAAAQHLEKKLATGSTK
jgi:putative membrane protein